MHQLTCCVILHAASRKGSDNSYALNGNAMVEDKNIEGLGGWLILVGLGVILSPLVILVTVFPTYFEIFSDGSWAILTTPGSTVYNPLWAPLLIVEIGINAGLVLAWVVAATLYFTKRKAFPKVYIAIVLFSLTFIILDAIAVNAVLPTEPVFDSATARQVGRTLITALIWIPYMLLSKRVKATFIR